MKLKNLKKGDVILVEYGFSIKKATIIKNLPEKEKIYLRVHYMFFGLIGENIVRSYHEHTFKDFEVLNEI